MLSHLRTEERLTDVFDRDRDCICLSPHMAESPTFRTLEIEMDPSGGVRKLHAGNNDQGSSPKIGLILKDKLG